MLSRAPDQSDLPGITAPDSREGYPMLGDRGRH
jgi:hypothetical protein